MLLAYHQQLDPLKNVVPASAIVSTILAALPVLVLFWLLVPRRWLAPKAGAAGAITAIVIAVAIYGMPVDMALMSFVNGAAFGMLPVGWTIFGAMLLYNITVETGQFAIVRRSVAGLSGDARIQAVLIGFAFGAFLEGSAGAGTPVAICGAILVGLGFHPFNAAVLCLIANTSPVAYGGLGTPLITLTGVTGIPTETLSIMAGHQLPLLSCIIPVYMVKCMCTWKQMFQVWPALVVAGGSFALFQFTFATIHAYVPAIVIYPMTDLGGGIFSLLLTALFLKFWKPKEEWHFPKEGVRGQGSGASEAGVLTPDSSPLTPLNWKTVGLAWAPYAIMSVLLVATGLVRQREGEAMKKGQFVHLGPMQTNYMIAVPTLDRESYRDPRLHVVRGEQAAALLLANDNPLAVAAMVPVARQQVPGPERAEYNFAWMTSPGSPVFAAACLSMLMLRMNRGQIAKVFRRTFYQMRIPIPTIACMLGLSYVTRYAGMDATLGVAFAETGWLYPYFAALLGWLGVFLTGTDAGSNALFGSLQKITANEVFNNNTASFEGLLEREQLQVLICTANSTGGVMGKMIDAQSICVATAATHQLGKEGDIFKAVLWHSIILASVVGLLTLAQAYVYPFTLMVPRP
ncbi:MAG TPA: L-lactate permease [Gemmataceae bacterium]|nr:L-lactate permease [Gemmataceae bacterium]